VDLRVGARGIKLSQIVASPSSIKINRRTLVTELEASSPIFKRVADEVMEKAFFLPAVEEMKADFMAHPVTQEIAGGLDSPNVSGTLEAPFREEEEEGDTIANLWGFIGFKAAEGDPLQPILDRLEPTHREGPKMVYLGRDPDKLSYRYEIRAPNEAAIYDATPLPWMKKGGPSWVRRIEQGVPGIGQFLNVSGRPSSRSGGGIQIAATLRTGRYRPVKYFSQILNNFLRRASGRGPSERRGAKG
jgi:hypothetical protein